MSSSPLMKTHLFGVDDHRIISLHSTLYIVGIASNCQESNPLLLLTLMGMNFQN